MPIRSVVALSTLALVAVMLGAVRTDVAARDGVVSAVPACGLRLPPPRSGEPRFAVPAGGRATLRSLADRIVLCTLLRADGSAFAHAEIDRLRHVLELRFFRTSGKLLFAADAAYPAFPRTEGARVSCGSAASSTTGERYWRQPIKWWVGTTPGNLPRAQVVQALRAAQSEWTNNVNWCRYPDRAEGAALYQGSTSSRFVEDGKSTVDWGSLSNVQGCNGSLGCTITWYDGDGTPVESDVRFNARLEWSVRPGAGGFDVQSVATHEFGHVRQFDHVTSQRLREYTLVMWPYFTRGDISGRRLGRGDSLADNKHY
jgi:hypothetical protein